MGVKDFKEGDQIVYGRDREPGFVTSTTNESVFCRFWSTTNIGSLRTLANSESCNPRDLNKVPENVPQEIVELWIKYIHNR